MQLEIGSILDSRYRVESILGSGTSGAVYKALDQHMGGLVALKVLSPKGLDRDESARRFEREAKILSQLNHPNIVKVLRYGFLADGAPYIAMEYLQGGSLRDLLLEKQSFKINEALVLAEKIADALSFAHTHNVLHRDLKPENIIVVENQPKIFDFGLSKIQDEAARQNENRTSTIKLSGTPAYMSPEQCMGRGVDERSDIYAFGCILFELISGRPPFQAESAPELMMMQIKQAPPHISKAVENSGLSGRLDALVFKCLQKNKDSRYLSFSELSCDLKDLLSLDISERLYLSNVEMKGKPGKKRLMVLLSLALALFLVGFCIPESLRTRIGITAVPELDSKDILEKLKTELMENRPEKAMALVDATLKSRAFLESNADEQEKLQASIFGLYLQNNMQDQAFDLGSQLIDSVLTRELRGFRKIGYGKDEQLLRNAFFDQMDFSNLNFVCRKMLDLPLSAQQWKRLQLIFQKRQEAFSIHAAPFRDAAILRVRANERGRDAERLRDINIAKDYLYVLHVMLANPSIKDLKLCKEMQEKLLAFSKRSGPLVEKEFYSYVLMGRIYLRAGEPGNAVRSYETARGYLQKYGDSSTEETRAFKLLQQELQEAGCKI